MGVLRTRVVAWLVTFGFGDLVGILALVKGRGAVVVVVGITGWWWGRLGRSAALASS